MCPWCNKKLVNRRRGVTENKLRCPQCRRSFWYDGDLQLRTRAFNFSTQRVEPWPFVEF